ncbi:hypothetical protein [Saccharopolyspora flava]|uniref:Excreted virulence factor EspC, type VII ESX diderm n=1 Tax=Saccharopolyspora flava TaxID=95161 RepID=A0A1I6P2M3_9PSEU|nr:hypothetical protein [Saccharopolyspora flava]SFS34320.1 hypothetical protein SAMN05660874_00384 [Saccharopolyspora flava]
MAGFVVDPAGLRGAISQLKGIKNDVDSLLAQAREVKPGELTADDTYTGRARKAIQDRATAESGSLSMITAQLRAKLDEKISAYQAVLDEYERNDDIAADSVNRVRREA